MNNKVAYVGLGHMGGPMAMHLAKAGHAISVYNRTRAKAEAFVAQFGGRVAESPADAVSEAAYVAACLIADEDSRSVTIGENGAFQAMSPGAVFVDHTTTTAETAEMLGTEAKASGIYYMDAPVAGAEEGAKAGQLTVMIGGPEEGYEKAKPFLSVYSKAAEIIGPNGHGQLTKMVNQIFISATMQGLAEGIVLGRESGLDLEKALQLLGQGSAQSWWLDNRARRLMDAELEEDGGISLMAKDLGICINEARRRAVSLPITAIIAQFFEGVRARGRGNWESPSLITLWDRRYD